MKLTFWGANCQKNLKRRRMGEKRAPEHRLRRDRREGGRDRGWAARRPRGPARRTLCRCRTVRQLRSGPSPPHPPLRLPSSTQRSSRSFQRIPWDQNYSPLFLRQIRKLFSPTPQIGRAPPLKAQMGSPWTWPKPGPIQRSVETVNLTVFRIRPYKNFGENKLRIIYDHISNWPAQQR